MATVSLVIVSHSSKLAEGVCEMARQMTQGAVTLFAAGGLQEDPSALGTDATRIATALQSADTGGGVLVFADLGSAILSTELAFELLDPVQRGRVRLSRAPLVEGALAAAVLAAAGGTLEQVEAEALRALGLKGPPSPTLAPPPASAPALAEEILLGVTLPNPLGLHARPAARLVSTAADLGVTMRACNRTAQGPWVDGRSLTQLVTLGVRQGDELGLALQGARAEEAARALRELIHSGFGESAQPPPKPSATALDMQPPPDALVGVPVAPGWIIGPAVFLEQAAPSIHVSEDQDPSREWTRLESAREAAQAELEQLSERAVLRGRKEEAEVLQAQRLLLTDPELLEAVQAILAARRINAEAAWWAAFSQIADRFRGLPDVYLQGRAADVLDVGERLLRWLNSGEAVSPPKLPPGILLARDLRPSDLACIDPAVTLGICTSGGSPVSHTAILARALGMPAAVGFGPRLFDLRPGTRVGLDGERGWLLIEPPLQESASRQQSSAANDSADRAAASAPARTRDGRAVEMAANIGSLAEARLAVRLGAEAVGVLRTEFLFLDRTSPPSEEEQVGTYSGILQAMEGRPVIARTLDIGGDKQVPYLALPVEDNPFLGQRGLRLSLLHPDLFRVQIRAMLRASAAGPLRLLFPMVTSLEELRAAKRIVQAVHEELVQAGIPAAEHVPIGMMVEVPSAALLAQHFAREVDFLSIGTNDLAQYTLAAERTNPELVTLGDGASPAVLQLIRSVVEAAHAAGIWAGVCGELAADPEVVPVLLGLGLDELSMGVAAIPRIKSVVRSWSFAAARELAEQALQLESAQEVRQLARSTPAH